MLYTLVCGLVASSVQRQTCGERRWRTHGTIYNNDTYPKGMVVAHRVHVTESSVYEGLREGLKQSEQFSRGVFTLLQCRQRRLYINGREPKCHIELTKFGLPPTNSLARELFHYSHRYASFCFVIFSPYLYDSVNNQNIIIINSNV